MSWEPTDEAQRIAAAIPAMWRAAKPADAAEVLAGSLRRILETTSLDRLNMAAYFVRRTLNIQARRLGARWGNEKGCFVQKETS